jgi:hypothetical protein
MTILKLTVANHVFMVCILADRFCCFIDVNLIIDGLLVECRDRKSRFVRFSSSGLLESELVFLAIDRVHRIGQDKPVHVKHFIVRSCPVFISSLQVQNVCHVIGVQNHREPDIKDPETEDGHH